MLPLGVLTGVSGVSRLEVASEVIIADVLVESEVSTMRLLL